MFYDVAITIPAGTTEMAPVEETLHITKGIIHSVEVRFRSGTDFRAAVRIYHLEHQLYPTNPDSDIRDDNRAVRWDEWYEIDGPPYLITVRGYAPTAAYAHVIYVRLGILPREVLTPFAGIGAALKRMLQLVGVYR